jgi:carboxylesterase
MSMGGNLAVLLARRVKLAGMVLISTPFDLPRDPRLRLLRHVLRPLSAIWRHARKAPRRWADPQAALEHLTYPVRPLRAVAELDRLLAETRRALRDARTPALLLHSRDDAAVAPEDAVRLHAALGSSKKELIWLEGSSHALTQDARREDVAVAVLDFVRGVEAA